MLIPLKTSIKLIVKIVDKDTKSLHEKSFNNKGWDALIANIEVRNRITHPKKIEDLAISFGAKNRRFSKRKPEVSRNLSRIQKKA